MQLMSPRNPLAFPCWSERISEARTSGTPCILCEGGRKDGDEEAGSTADRSEAAIQLGNGPNEALFPVEAFVFCQCA